MLWQRITPKGVYGLKTLPNAARCLQCCVSGDREPSYINRASLHLACRWQHGHELPLPTSASPLSPRNPADFAASLTRHKTTRTGWKYTHRPYRMLFGLEKIFQSESILTGRQCRHASESSFSSNAASWGESTEATLYPTRLRNGKHHAVVNNSDCTLERRKRLRVVTLRQAERIVQTALTTKASVYAFIS